MFQSSMNLFSTINMADFTKFMHNHIKKSIKYVAVNEVVAILPLRNAI